MIEFYNFNYLILGSSRFRLEESETGPGSPLYPIFLRKAKKWDAAAIPCSYARWALRFVPAVVAKVYNIFMFIFCNKSVSFPFFVFNNVSWDQVKDNGILLQF